MQMNARLVIAAGCFAIMVVLSAPTVANAEALACDQTIYDQGGLLHNRQPATLAAAMKLKTIGIDIRVTDLQSFHGYPTLVSYTNARQKACASWKSATGSWKPSLLVIVATIKERKIGVFYAPSSKIAAAFRKGGGSRRIGTDFIYPKIYQATWPAGFVAGMNEVYRVVNSYLHP
jgi:hypothetical protein